MTIRPLVMDEVCDLLERSERRAIDLCRGTSSFDVRPHLTAESGVDEVAATSLGSYGDATGLPELREQLSCFYRACYGVDISPSRFIVCDGGSGALTLALMSLERSGDLLLPAVAYPLYRQVAALIGTRCVGVRVSASGQLDVSDLERKLTPGTRAILINSPHNPFGTVLSRRELEQVLSYGVPVVSDEVYNLLGPDSRATSMIELSDHCYVVGSFSKMFALPGLRIGYLIAPTRTLARVTALKRHLNITTSVPSQMIATRVLPAWARITERHRAHLRSHRDVFLELARGLDLLSVPQAGLFGLIDLGRDGHAIPSAEAARDLARDHGVAVAPSCDFAADARSERDAHEFLRINFATNHDVLAEGIARIKDYLVSKRRKLSRTGGLTS